MSKRLDVLLAVKALIVAALPDADVQGIDSEDAAPDRIGPNGRAYVESGDPGAPEIDLSPLSYNYEHQIPVYLDGVAGGGLTAEQAVDAMADKVSAAIEADRFLGGLVDFLDATAPPGNDDYIDAASSSAGLSLTITASYSTTHPL
jgi:hypothetical protein